MPVSRVRRGSTVRNISSADCVAGLRRRLRVMVRKFAVFSFSVMPWPHPGLPHASRHRLRELPQDQAQLFQVGHILVESDLRRGALGLADGVDRALVLPPGARPQLPT